MFHVKHCCGDVGDVPRGTFRGSLEVPRAERAPVAANRSPPTSDQRERPSEKWRATLRVQLHSTPRLTLWPGSSPSPTRKAEWVKPPPPSTSPPPSPPPRSRRCSSTATP